MSDARGLELADSHYSRRRSQVGESLFVGPGRKLVLVTADARALWVSRWEHHPRHAWPASSNCALFRNEGAGLSSALIREAVAEPAVLAQLPLDLGAA